MASVRALIVDDEPPARRKLRILLKDRPEIQVVGEACNATEAVRMIEADPPDLVFLDIHLPDLDAFELISALAPSRLPHIVFVSAFDEHAVRAFEVGAVDYLLKPVDQERFDKALRRVLGQLHSPREEAFERRIEGVLKSLATRGVYLKRFLIKTQDRMFFVTVGEIDWIESAGNYVRLHAGQEAHLVRGTLREVERRLDPGLFVRIHRSAIVNLDRVQRLEPWSHGDLLLFLRDGTRLRLSRRYRDRLPPAFGEG